ncbi:L-threonylcarbamoyladenylate synthase [Legionella waltersii]|uniref:Threonylcarbamoyl-AMP synthase n=1 Tax=Legionella waltersii TaxID=66969 RepID=A0A0W1A514_9GAMM|nr:L-threonylcarbamoyladenylate synthase [Legionella waltersii]KTD76460.1 SUA5/yciO/yrdC family transporter:Sua5/YciO/YrdC/YwlC family transporter protein [Legionella waltersii]SNV14576.1 putative translation factor [Legionella waltersii]
MSTITNDLNQAILDLQAGKLVAIPTETVYGLAAIITNEDAIKAVFEMKHRPLNHPLIIHIAENLNLDELVEEVPEYAQQLITKFWPGPLTFVFQAKKGKINPLITGGQSTVAIRCPDHSLTQKLLSKLKTPVVAPSANPFGKVSPTTAQHVQESFPEEALTILNGGRCNVGIESTIIDATDPNTYQILRHGMIDENAIAKVVSTQFINRDNSIRVPGKLENHYQPEKNLYYFEHYEALAEFCLNRGRDVYVIASQEPPEVEPKHFHLLANSPEKAAYELYFQLREADASDAICIAIELPPETSEWQGVRERILKAGMPYSS